MITLKITMVTNQDNYSFMHEIKTKKIFMKILVMRKKCFILLIIQLNENNTMVRWRSCWVKAKDVFIVGLVDDRYKQKKAKCISKDVYERLSI